MEDHVSLERQFSLVPKSQEETEDNEFLSILGHAKPKTWDDIDKEFRCIILAEAGAGKTVELRQRAHVLTSQGKPAFFIRIEDIETDFYKAFEIGEEAQFQTWLQSTGEAWFFLDSVDEARLKDPRSFEKALRCFAKGIKSGAHRAHIYLSSRPYAWRPKEDRKLLDEILYLAVPQETDNNEEGRFSEPRSALSIYTILPLDEERIRRFCIARNANNIDRLLHEIERTNLWSLAERPFDLEGVLAKWEEDNALGGRLELLRHNIDMRLRDDHNSNRAQRQPLNLERARKGARRLAAAVVLTGQAGINVPDATHIKSGINAESVLADWEPNDVYSLLERGIFNDIIYDTVRFRHRDVRELLAAEWFEELLKTGISRHMTETIFFREQYGQIVITPRVRPILPWLILFDDEIRSQALAIKPEIAVEGGDPSRLPLPARKRILVDIVRRIVSHEDDHSARDNNAIARIANSDLVEDTQQLINKYGNNDDAIFFLARLVWQGEMTSCVSPLIAIAVDGTRGLYGRIASARAVMICGSVDQKQSLWQKLNEDNVQIQRELLVELVQEAVPDSNTVAQMLISLGKLPPYERFKGTGLSRALHEFIERLPIDVDQQVITQFLDGLHDYLERRPYIERRECRVSNEYAWLLSPATHVVERLVEARSKVAFGMVALSTMLKVPALRFWRDSDFGEQKGNLHVLVPSWPELNDALYWASIDQARSAQLAKSGEPLTKDWFTSYLDHYWAFDTESFQRLLDYISSRQLHDDRLVALSTAFRVYMQADKPEHMLISLKSVACREPVVQNQLDLLLNPPVSEEMRRYEEQNAEYRRKYDEEKERDKQNRDTWITGLRANPGRVRNPPNLKLGEISRDQYWLMLELQDRVLSTGRSDYANWQALILNFGEDVARAYRDAAVNCWRHYMPILRSEGGQNNSVPYALIFCMAGLEIEATENTEFPDGLNEAEVRHALRYITWELNGLPTWFECMYQAFPTLVKETVIKEILWELENTEPDKPMHYILSDISYHAPWIHNAIAPALLELVEDNPIYINTNQYYCLNILVNGGISPSKLAVLANKQIAQANNPDNIPGWYALYVDCDPINGIPEVERWLSGLDMEAATHAAQIFITVLMGDRHVIEGRSYFGLFRTADHLKLLYILMHKYIPVEKDINRMAGKVYSPKLRDKAQDARNGLFHLLSKIPGKESYSLIKQLISEHPDPSYRPWIAQYAYKRAEEDADIEPWTAEQVSMFAKAQSITPATYRQLFDLTVHRLLNLKKWLEHGNDSPWQTWQRANDETEMRTLIAGWLNQHCREQYTTAQEPELANGQRMDIWLQNTNVRSPVPIELKLLDKGWTGPQLCERLRNQLVGDYLREEGAQCGVMLLVWQGRNKEKRWKINNRRVGLSELASALKLYWQSIADEYVSVEVIEVVVIDLTIRAHISDL